MSEKATSKKVGRGPKKGDATLSVEDKERLRASSKKKIEEDFSPVTREFRVTSERKLAFLKAYAEIGVISRAAQAAGVGKLFPYLWARDDPEFAEDMYEARKMAVQVLEDAAFRRAIYGVRRPVYQQGLLIGFERVYSDGMAQFLLKGNKPELYGTTMLGRPRNDRSNIPESYTSGNNQQGLSDETAEEIRKKVFGIDDDEEPKTQ